MFGGIICSTRRAAIFCQVPAATSAWHLLLQHWISCGFGSKVRGQEHWCEIRITGQGHWVTSSSAERWRKIPWTKLWFYQLKKRTDPVRQSAKEARTSLCLTCVNVGRSPIITSINTNTWQGVPFKYRVVRLAGVGLTGLGWAGVGLTGLGWTSLGWGGPHWAGVGLTGLGWTSLGWGGPHWAGVGLTGLGWASLGWASLGLTGLGWGGPHWAGVGLTSLGWGGPHWAGVGLTGVGWGGPHWGGLGLTGLGWTGLEWAGVGLSSADPHINIVATWRTGLRPDVDACQKSPPPPKFPHPYRPVRAATLHAPPVAAN